VAGFNFGGGRGGAWQEARRRFARAEQSIQKRQGLAVRRAALLAEREIKKGIKSGAPGGEKFKPLSPITKLLKKSSKPLIDTGGLLGSIKTTYDAKKNQAFVGVHRASRAGGINTVNLAIIHEFGTKPFTIPVTPGVRAFFMRLFIISGGKINPLGAGKTQIIHPGVPPRPFIRPTIKKIRPQLQEMIRVTLGERGGPI